MMGGATHNTQFGMPQVGGGMHGAGVLGGGSGVQHMGAGYARHDTQSIFHKNKPRQTHFSSSKHGALRASEQLP